MVNFNAHKIKHAVHNIETLLKLIQLELQIVLLFSMTYIVKKNIF